MNDLNDGINALILDFSMKKNWTNAELNDLFNGIEVQYISIHFRNIQKENVQVFCDWIEKQVVNKIEIEMTSEIHIHASCKSIGINISDINSMAKALEVIELNKDKTGSIYFEIEIGSNYFYEISKILALKFLWEKMMSYYQQKDKIYIIGKTAHNNKTGEDINRNMLRITTESMSAILGGVHVMYVKPFDDGFKEINEFSRRMAKNIQLILADESGFGLVQDTTKGSYYIEQFAKKLAEKTWERFRMSN